MAARGTTDRARIPGAARVVLAGSGVEAFGTGLTLPFLLIYLHQVRGIPLGTTGLLLALPGLVGFATGPLGGLAADRLGVRRVLVVGVLAEGSGQGLLALVHTPTQAVPAVLLTGIGRAIFFPSQNGLFARLADGAALQRLFALNFVLINAGIGLGGVLAGAAVTVTHPGSFQLVYLIDAATFFAYAVALAVLRIQGPRVVAGAREGSYREVLTHPLFLRLFALSLLLALVGYTQVDSGLPAFATVVLGLPPRAVAAALVANTALIVIGQLVVLRRIETWRRTRALWAVAGIWAASWLLLGSAVLVDGHPGRWVVLLAFGALFGLGETFMAPTVAPLTNAVAPEHLRGRFFAITSLSYSLAFTIAPPVSTALIGAHLAGVWIALLVAGCALLALLAARLERRLRPDQNQALAQLPDPETLLV